MAFKQPTYIVEILDNSFNLITRVRTLVALDSAGTVIDYATALSTYGHAKIRVGTKDPLFTQFSVDILRPWANHLRITRGNAVVWQGVIVNCPRRNNRYVEVQAYTYLFYLKKVLIRHDTSGDTNYRTFTSGTLASTVQTLLTEAKADNPTLLAKLVNGTLENPNYPTGYVDTANAALTGAWNWTNNFPIKYDYRDLFYVFQSLAVYSKADFELVYDSVTNNMTFNYRTAIGVKQPDVTFQYTGNNALDNVENYNAPLYGERMINSLLGVAADNDSKIFTLTKDDTNSQNTLGFGKLQGVAAYIDVKDKNLLTTRLTEELAIVSTPDTELQLVLNDRAYPLGVYGLGDTVNLRVKDHFINVNVQRRIVSIDCKVKGNGRDTIRLVTNVPRPT